MQSDYKLYDFCRESHRDHSKKISNQIEGIATWIDAVEGKNKEEAILFIETYLSCLNSGTCGSMFEYIKNITDTQLIEINKRNNLYEMILELKRIKEQIKIL